MNIEDVWKKFLRGKRADAAPRNLREGWPASLALSAGQYVVADAEGLTTRWSAASLATVSMKWLRRNDRLFGGVRGSRLRLLLGVLLPIDKLEHKREIPDLQQSRGDEGPGNTLPDRPRGNIGPSPDNTRRRQHSDQELRKIHRPNPLHIPQRATRESFIILAIAQASTLWRPLADTSLFATYSAPVPCWRP